MNTVLLNTINLDGGVIIKKGSGGGGGVTINNQSKSVDIVENGTTEIVADSGYTGLGKVVVNTNVASSGGGSGWTGHADAEGLRAIGWTDEDIAYYQEHGVNWNAEDDEYHKVSDDNKALYGVLTADNISSYKDRIVYLPKIDTSAKTSMSQMFNYCYSLVAIPQMDTSNVTNMSYMFSACSSLVSIPQLDTSKVINASYMFGYCYNLISVPQMDTSNVTDMNNMFKGCSSLVSIPQLDTSKVINASYMFESCHSLTVISQLNMPMAENIRGMFSNCNALTTLIVEFGRDNQSYNMFDACYPLVTLHIDKARSDYNLSYSPLLSKDSLLYIINNNNAKNIYSGITITLHSYTYERLATDPDIVEALTNYPKVKIASA